MPGIWERIQEWWWRDHSATHHNREMPDVARMKRDIKRLRQDGRDDLADQMQRRVDREEKEAREYQ